MLVLPARLMHQDAAACMRMLAQSMAAHGDATAVVDAGALTSFDSSALAVLLECRREAGTFGRGFCVRNMPARLRELATLYGVEGLLPDASAGLVPAP